MGHCRMSSNQGEKNLNTPDISVVEIRVGGGGSETKENLDKTGTPYLSSESSVVQNEDKDSEEV